jgi:hypothetical protein
VLFRNSLVLALHAMACVAGFIAGSSLPQSAAQRSGISRFVHDKAGPLAIGFVACATTFSLITQAYVLGGGVSTVSAELGISRGLLLIALLPHALPELVALFLPLAAWLVASRRGDWHKLLAATFVTVAISAPVLVVSALVEVYVSPHLLLALSHYATMVEFAAACVIRTCGVVDTAIAKRKGRPGGRPYLQSTSSCRASRSSCRGP